MIATIRPTGTAFFLLFGLALAPFGLGQTASYEDDPFRQLEELLPTPDEARTASGAPGPKYWQQRADYDIKVRLDDVKRRLIGTETIRYQNRSPHALTYLWLQLDQNRLSKDGEGKATEPAPGMDGLSYGQLDYLLESEKFDGGVKLKRVADKAGKELPYQVVKTMMRIDLPEPLMAGATVEFAIDWEHNVVDEKKIWARGGYEWFEKDKNAIYEIAQWYPRMVAYTDVNGWQHKQFLGKGEFTLEFGDYRVEITAPADHIVAASGELRNADKVLDETQRARLKEAEKAKEPVFIVTPEEAKTNEKSRAKGEKTWVFEAKNVRDFAWASSRKFIWDAVHHGFGEGGKKAWAMSYYPNEGEPLWSRYSTQAIMHTLDVYSKFTFDYPYPVAISVNGPVFGMEYPMICFNGPRPEEDGTYSERTKYGLISVIIHEVGHNWFPMIVNSDERQWTWMDEGLNTFLQFLSEEEWEADYPGAKGHARTIAPYMAGPGQVPIMTNSDSLKQFGNNAYQKPATALNVLRETVLGRELFDFAFKEYARRWMFKRPSPADLFRTMEDASGVDLDWFWRGWFYTTKHVDVAVGKVYHWELRTGDPDVDKAKDKLKREEKPRDPTQRRNAELPKRIDRFPDLKDFYNAYDELDVTEAQREDYQKMFEKLDKDEKRLLKTQRHFYVVELENRGGLVTPVILLLTYENGKTEEIRMPAEYWRYETRRVPKLLLTRYPVTAIEVDPYRETADADEDNNYWPARPLERTFQLRKDEQRGGGPNPMREKQAAEERARKVADKPKDSGASQGGEKKKAEGGGDSQKPAQQERKGKD